MPKYDWDTKFEEFAFYSLLTKPEVVQALCKSEYECLEARNKQLFHVPLAKHMRLEEFEQTQSQATQQVSLFLKVISNVHWQYLVHYFRTHGSTTCRNILEQVFAIARKAGSISTRLISTFIRNPN